jgi:hypothetical protein
VRTPYHIHTRRLGSQGHFCATPASRWNQTPSTQRACWSRPPLPPALARLRRASSTPLPLPPPPPRFLENTHVVQATHRHRAHAVHSSSDAGGARQAQRHSGGLAAHGQAASAGCTVEQATAQRPQRGTPVSLHSDVSRSTSPRRDKVPLGTSSTTARRANMGGPPPVGRKAAGVANRGGSIRNRKYAHLLSGRGAPATQPMNTCAWPANTVH